MSGVSQLVDETEHVAAVARLRASHAAIPPGVPVRLAKRTSNLFRPRAGAQSAGLDVSGLDRVLSVDPEGRTAVVQGMCTYEHLVDATLPYGLMPLVVPQLRTITLGGAVTGLGIESTSLRNGLPHESVLEMDVLTGDGQVITTKPGDELFDAFPNSYGSLGYATRLVIELEPIGRFVALRHLRFTEADELADVVRQIAETESFDGERVDAVDGVAFGPDDLRLTLARFNADPGPTSDYTGAEIYYRSVEHRSTDLLSAYDYLWRWDTDWFWCSGAFGLHNPRIRRAWPRRWRRSDVYHKLVGLDLKYRIVERLDARKGLPKRERVIQDIEVPLDRLGEFLDWFDPEIGMRPVWLCPLRLRGEKTWPLYPLDPGRLYLNAGFWGTVPVGPEAAEGPRNRAIEAKVHELGGHKSLYSEAFYDRETFDALYNGPHLARIKKQYDPHNRLTSLYDKAVRRA